MKKVRRFCEAVQSNPRTQAFRVLNSEEEPEDWLLEPIRRTYLSEDDGYGLHIVRAFQIFSDGSLNNCFLDISLTNRWCDYAYFITGNTVIYDYYYKFPGHIIPQMAIDCFGNYELFYSRTLPQAGIAVLKTGLNLSTRKTWIALDLAYILRDEKRYGEAIEMFHLAAEEGTTSYYVYGELAYCYKMIGETLKAEFYDSIYRRLGGKQLQRLEASLKEWAQQVSSQPPKTRRQQKKSPGKKKR